MGIQHLREDEQLEYKEGVHFSCTCLDDSFRCYVEGQRHHVIKTVLYFHGVEWSDFIYTLVVVKLMQFVATWS